MSLDLNEAEVKQYRCKEKHYRSHTGNAIYGLGMIGAAIFFIGQATTFWMGVLGFLKAIIWPVFLVLQAFQALM